MNVHKRGEKFNRECKIEQKRKIEYKRKRSSNIVHENCGKKIRNKRNSGHTKKRKCKCGVKWRRKLQFTTWECTAECKPLSDGQLSSIAVTKLLFQKPVEAEDSKKFCMILMKGAHICISHVSVQVKYLIQGMNLICGVYWAIKQHHLAFKVDDALCWSTNSNWTMLLQMFTK